MTTLTDLTTAQMLVLGAIKEGAKTPRQVKQVLLGSTPVAVIRRLVTELIEFGYVQQAEHTDPLGPLSYRLADGILCPGDCGHLMNPVQVRNALSRFDNETYVCSSCGTREAMANFCGDTITAPGVISYA